MWSIHTMKYDSALTRKEILIHATTWTNLENIMLSEISQSQKDKYCMTVKSIEMENRMGVARGWGKGVTGCCCLMCTEFQFHKMKRVLEMNCTTMNILNTSELCI